MAEYKLNIVAWIILRVDDYSEFFFLLMVFRLQYCICIWHVTRRHVPQWIIQYCFCSSYNNKEKNYSDLVTLHVVMNLCLVGYLKSAQYLSAAWKAKNNGSWPKNMELTFFCFLYLREYDIFQASKLIIHFDLLNI